MSEIMDVRRKAFEVTAREHYFLHELDHSWSDREQEYHDSDMQVAWEVYNSALDSVCVELPGRNPEYIGDRDHQQWACGCNYGINQCREAIERSGLKVKP